MTRPEATAMIFLTAFKSLPKKERWFILARFLKDHDLREDMIDIALIEERRKEPSRSWTSYLKSHRKG